MLAKYLLHLHLGQVHHGQCIIVNLSAELFSRRMKCQQRLMNATRVLTVIALGDTCILLPEIASDSQRVLGPGSELVL